MKLIIIELMFTLVVFVLVTFVSPTRGEMCSALVSASNGGGIEDLSTLQGRAVAAFTRGCRKQHNSSCTFITTPTTPYSFKFILRPASVPFKILFTVKALTDVIVALAESKTHESTFAQIIIGGRQNTRSTLSSCDEMRCTNLLDHVERGLLNVAESRPFWIEFNAGGVVTVGKGGHNGSFLKGNVGASRIPSKVYFGISTAESVSGSWVFYNFCE